MGDQIERSPCGCGVVVVVASLSSQEFLLFLCLTDSDPGLEFVYAPLLFN
jgi:hypothetical protein